MKKFNTLPSSAVLYNSVIVKAPIMALKAEPIASVDRMIENCVFNLIQSFKKIVRKLWPGEIATPFSLATVKSWAVELLVTDIISKFSCDSSYSKSPVVYSV